MTAYHRSLIVFLLLGITILGGGFYGFWQAENVENLSTGVQESPPSATLVVYVCGAVNKPGVVRVGEGDRVVDAVKACGDLLPSADATGINMAQSLKDGAKIIVPEKPMVVEGAESRPVQTGDTKNSSGKININTADAAELDKLPGIGPVMAAAIVEHRQSEGKFQTPEDLMKVRGIGAAKFKKLQDKITL